MSKNLKIVHIAPAVDLAAVGQRVRQAHVALQDAERREEAANKAAESARDEAARRRLELGRALVEARKAWPASGPKAKGWGDFLRQAGIEERNARNWMALAGHIHHEVSEPGVVGSEIPTRREVTEARRQERLLEVVKSTPSEPIEILTDEAEEEEEPAPIMILPARQPPVLTNEVHVEIRPRDLWPDQPPTVETPVPNEWLQLHAAAASYARAVVAANALSTKFGSRSPVTKAGWALLRVAEEDLHDFETAAVHDMSSDAVAALMLEVAQDAIRFYQRLDATEPDVGWADAAQLWQEGIDQLTTALGRADKRVKNA